MAGLVTITDITGTTIITAIITTITAQAITAATITTVIITTTIIIIQPDPHPAATLTEELLPASLQELTMPILQGPDPLQEIRPEETPAVVMQVTTVKVPEDGIPEVGTQAMEITAIAVILVTMAMLIIMAVGVITVITVITGITVQTAIMEISGTTAIKITLPPSGATATNLQVSITGKEVTTATAAGAILIITIQPMLVQETGSVM